MDLFESILKYSENSPSSTRFLVFVMMVYDIRKLKRVEKNWFKVGLSRCKKNVLFALMKAP